MSLLLYTSSPLEEFPTRLINMVVGITTGEDLTLDAVSTLEDLAARLRWPWKDQTIVVLHISNEQELSHTSALGDLLRDTRMILIVPKRKQATIAKGHELHPRFLTFADEDPTQIGAVLAKMLDASPRPEITNQES